MAKIRVKSNMDFEFHLTMNEDEARALRAITKYGHKSFIDNFFKSMGKSELEPHTKGLETLFDKVKNLDGPFNQVNATKKFWAERAQELV